MLMRYSGALNYWRAHFPFSDGMSQDHFHRYHAHVCVLQKFKIDYLNRSRLDLASSCTHIPLL